jgi:transcriptional regulator with XRE-family HTH domain
MPKGIVKSGEIGAVIRNRRKELGLSQEELAEMVGVSYQQIQRYENGSTMLNVENMQRIAQVLSMPITGFFKSEAVQKFVEPSTQILNAEEKSLIKLFRSLYSESDRKLAIRIIRRFTRR